ncbi:hypothetical protein [Aliivibrio fischeri]|uniref:hypothetical protein n=1 Tax=Aliivibrio fischeri TaxID=668 RepID=UPI0007C4CD0D|nr:hypothetical protein [Aliivibrio fischeri]
MKKFLTFGFFAMFISGSAFADTFNQRTHLINAQNHIKQAQMALDNAALSSDKTVRINYKTDVSKAMLSQISQSIDDFLSEPLQPQISPEIWEEEQEGEY